MSCLVLSCLVSLLVLSCLVLSSFAPLYVRLLTPPIDSFFFPGTLPSNPQNKHKTHRYASALEERCEVDRAFLQSLTKRDLCFFSKGLYALMPKDRQEKLAPLILAWSTLDDNSVVEDEPSHDFLVEGEEDVGTDSGKEGSWAAMSSSSEKQEGSQWETLVCTPLLTGQHAMHTLDDDELFLDVDGESDDDLVPQPPGPPKFLRTGRSLFNPVGGRGHSGAAAPEGSSSSSSSCKKKKKRKKKGKKGTAAEEDKPFCGSPATHHHHHHHHFFSSSSNHHHHHAVVADPRFQDKVDKLNEWLSRGGHLTKPQARNTNLLLDAAQVGHDVAARALLEKPGNETPISCRIGILIIT